jgi:hypothetical protein
MMNFDGGALKQGFKDAFGKDIDSLTSAQIWWLIKVMKHTRGRCRSNVALHNYLRRNFTGHTFTEVDAVNRRGESFKALKVGSKLNLKDEVSESAADE